MGTSDRIALLHRSSTRSSTDRGCSSWYGVLHCGHDTTVSGLSCRHCRIHDKRHWQLAGGPHLPHVPFHAPRANTCTDAQTVTSTRHSSYSGSQEYRQATAPLPQSIPSSTGRSSHSPGKAGGRAWGPSSSPRRPPPWERDAGTHRPRVGPSRIPESKKFNFKYIKSN